MRFGCFAPPYERNTAVGDEISEVILFITHLVSLFIRVVSQGVVVEFGVV